MSDVYNSIHLYLISRWKKVVYIWIYSVVWLNVWPSCFLFIRPFGLGRMDKNLSQVEQFSRLLDMNRACIWTWNKNLMTTEKRAKRLGTRGQAWSQHVCALFFISLSLSHLSLHISLPFSNTLSFLIFWHSAQRGKILSKKVTVSFQF